MANYLWTFTDTPASITSSISLNDLTNANTVTLPTIVPASIGANNATVNTLKTSNLVDVVNSFYWTYSNLNRQEVPYILLTERKLRTNALISQLKYSLGQASNGIDQTVSNLESYTTNPTIKGFIQGAGNLAQLGVQTINNIAGNISGYGDDNNPTVTSSYWLQPYQNLYLTDPTGWVYKLPYFDNNHAQQANAFSDAANLGGVQGLLGQAAGYITEFAEVAASINNPSQITYIEKTKFYNYPSEGEDINIEFPLINTGSVTYDDVVRNWQLLFLLLYQNRPGKTSNNTVDQPVIYQVEVPGVKFFPFCYVTGLTVDFVGSRREMIIKVPSSNTFSEFAGDLIGEYLSTTAYISQITAIIPDAYKVRISLKSMTANSKNFMQHLITNHNVVEAGTLGGG